MYVKTLCITALLWCIAPCDAKELPDVDWLNWVVVNTQPGTLAHGEKMTDLEKLDFIRDFDPDMFDWWSGALMNRAYIATMRGIAADSSIEYEYEAPLHGVKFFADEIYGANGPGIKEDGRPPVDGYGDTQMTHLAPKWHETVKSGHTRLSLYGDMVCQDNLIHGLHYNYGQFDDWSNRRFVAYMVEKFPESHLDKMAFNPETFHIRPYLREQRKTKNNEMLIEDPIIHEYIRFYYVSLIDAVAEFTELIHESPSNLSPAQTAFYGNLGSMTMTRTPGLAYSEHVDMVWIERVAEDDQPCFEKTEVQARSSLMYKIGSSAGHFEKAVCTYLEPPERAKKRIPSAIVAAEAYANGGLMVLASHFKRYGGADGPLYKAHAHHARFANAHRELFIDRQGVADVAIVNSIPSMFWRWFSSLETERPHLVHMEAAARLLEDHHIPYKVVMFGHPDIYNDTDHLESLKNYKILVLPNVDCISGRQVEAVVQWVRAGGKLVLWAEAGTRDEELNIRTKNAFEELIENPGIGSVVTTNTLGPLTDPRTGLVSDITEAYIHDKSKEAEEKLVGIFIQPDSLLETDLPRTVWANVWQHGAGPMTTVQMVNYDIDMASDSVAVVSNFTVKVRVPDGVVFSQATYFHTSYLAEDFRALPKAQILPLQIKDGYAEVTIPHLGVFGVLSLTTNDEQEAREIAAQVRKWYQRLKIAHRVPGWKIDDEVVSLLESAEDYLAGIQGDVMVANFQDFIEPGRTLAGKLKASVEEVTVQVPQQRADRLEQTLATDTIHKFDFGADGDSPEDWKSVSVDTDYTEQTGYGWVQTGPLTVVGDKSEGVATDMAAQLSFDDLAQIDSKDCHLVDGVVSNGVALSRSQSSMVFDDRGVFDPEDGSFTVSGWLKTGDVVKTPKQIFISKGNRTNSDAGWSILETEGRLAFRLNDRGTFLPLVTTLAKYLGPNQWYHFTFVVDRDKKQAVGYVNGSRFGGHGSHPLTKIPSSAVFSSEKSLCIGNAGVDNLYNPGFAVDDFRVWNHALSSAEITDLYEEGIAKSAADESVQASAYGELDRMHEDYIRSSNPVDYMTPSQNSHYPVVLPPANEAEFRVDLSNGEYIVTAVVGDRDEFYNAHRVGTTYIDAEGVPAAYGERLNSGRYQNRVFPVTVNDGHLDLRFWGRNVGPLYQNNCDWMINGLLIQKLGQTLAPQAARSLAETKKHAATVLRDWWVIGPFPDPDWLGFEKNFGPEQSTDRNRIYNADVGRLAWEATAPLIGDAPYVSFNGMLEGTSTNGACAFAMARVSFPVETDAVLSVSTSQFGEVYLNGQKVLTDHLPAGLLGREYKTIVRLNSGLNTIVIKTLNHWGDEWAVWASLTDSGGGPLQNIEVQ